MLNTWFASMVGTSDLFGLAITLGSFGALFVGFIGWCVGITIPYGAVDAPRIEPNIGPFIVAVCAGETPELARSVLHSYGGHDVPSDAMQANPSTA
jgi:hypothetical protein